MCFENKVSNKLFLLSKEQKRSAPARKEKKAHISCSTTESTKAKQCHIFLLDIFASCFFYSIAQLSITARFSGIKDCRSSLVQHPVIMSVSMKFDFSPCSTSPIHSFLTFHSSLLKNPLLRFKDYFPLFTHLSVFISFLYHITSSFLILFLCKNCIVCFAC